jgi:hypothetical protein
MFEIVMRLASINVHYNSEHENATVVILGSSFDVFLESIILILRFFLMISSFWQVLSMTPERRELAADRLAWRVWQCIETAGEKNRDRRGIKRDRRVSKQAESMVADTFLQSEAEVASTTASLEMDSDRSLEVMATHAGRGVSRSITSENGSKVNKLRTEIAMKRSTQLR